MIRHLAVVLTIAWLAGCAATGSKLDPGATRAEVEKTMGKVTESLVGANGEFPLTGGGTERVLELTAAEHEFVFEGVTERPVPSLLRGFSAPVKLRYDYGRGPRATDAPRQRRVCALGCRADAGDAGAAATHGRRRQQ